MIKSIFISVFLLILTSCATFNLEAPSVAITNITPNSSGGLDLLFNVDLRITNPNSVTLPIKGMSYKIAFNGADVFQGVSNDIPNIPAYGSENITLSVGTNLLSAPKLLLSFIRNPQQKVDYQFTSKIDLDGPLPSFNIVETGSLSGE